MEVSEKELIYILKNFIEFCSSNAECGLYEEEFQGKEIKIINEFIETFYPALYTGKYL